MNDYTIRPVQREDLQALLVLFAKHARHEQAVFDPTNKLTLLEEAIFSINPSLYCWVVEADQTCVGYCAYIFDFSTWDAKNFLHMDCLYLEPAYRSRGIGKEIIKRLAIEATLKNCVNMQWQTPVFNAGAIKFYRTIGAEAKQKQRFTLAL